MSSLPPEADMYDEWRAESVPAMPDECPRRPRKLAEHRESIYPEEE